MIIHNHIHNPPGIIYFKWHIFSQNDEFCGGWYRGLLFPADILGFDGLVLDVRGVVVLWRVDFIDVAAVPLGLDLREDRCCAREVILK